MVVRFIADSGPYQIYLEAKGFEHVLHEGVHLDPVSSTVPSDNFVEKVLRIKTDGPVRRVMRIQILARDSYQMTGHHLSQEPNAMLVLHIFPLALGSFQESDTP